MAKIAKWLEETIKFERSEFIALMLMWSVFSVLVGQIAIEQYREYERAKYEVVDMRYIVRPGDTFWDITQYYRRFDDRDIYLQQFQYEVMKDNPAIEARHCQLQPGDLIRIKYYRLK